MYTKEKILAIHEARGKPTSRHQDLSATRLADLSKLLEAAGIKHVPDPEYPYHMIVEKGNKLYSVFHGGLNDFYEVVLLKPVREDNIGYSTPEEVIQRL